MKIINKTLKNYQEVESLKCEIIEPFKSELKDKDIQELYQVGKFISRLRIDGNDIELKCLCEPPLPDFIATFAGLNVGIEHTRIDIEQRSQEINTIQTLLRNAQDKFNSKYGNIEKMIYLELNSELKYKKKEKDEIEDKIVQLVSQYLKDGKMELNSTFPFSIKYDIPSDNTYFEYNIGVITRTNIKNEFLDEIIKKKASKNYDTHNIDKLWLLIVESSIPNSFNTSFINNYTVEQNKFDKIFIFRSFHTDYKEIVKNSL